LRGKKWGKQRVKPTKQTTSSNKAAPILQALQQFLTQLTQQNAVLVEVHATRGSVPRERGAWMAVFAHTQVGTIGGGHLELQALAYARALLQTGHAERLRRFALGPSLGQCCGGEVQLRFTPVGRSDAADLPQRLAPAQTPLALFGGGHVGRALVQVLANLPLRVQWVDSRDEIFPTQLPSNVQAEHSNPVQAAVPSLPSGARVLIMSFSHAEDLEIVAACLLRQRVQADLPFVGLIGSQTKWAVFQRRLQDRGFCAPELAHITCPIGVPGIRSKAPEVIAVAVAAQLLQTLDVALA
jgi:xanthine dehydrogenase accessory factor